MNCTVIIPAGGTGTRMGADIPKQFLELDGKPLIIHTLEMFEEIDEINSVVISLHKEWHQFVNENLKKYNISKVKEMVYSGEKRQDSVFNAIKTQTVFNSDVILVHDAVRPFTSKELILKVIEEAEETGAVIPAIDTKDTIKERTPKNFVLKTFLRSNLCNAQTPQGYWYDVLYSAYTNAEKNSFTGTDSSSLVEYNGYKVTIVDGEEENFKITSPFDFHLAELMLNK